MNRRDRPRAKPRALIRALDVALRETYRSPVIRSFADKRTAAIWQGLPPRGVARELAQRARARLVELASAPDLPALSRKRGNRLEVLRGDRAGQHSIRVNDQWRICFVWRSDGPHEVELVDYH